MRHFTVEEANALLPILTSVLEDMRGIYTRAQKAAEVIHKFEQLAAQNGHGERSPVFDPAYDLDAMRQELDQRMQYLAGIGVHLKDIENGILDFPSRMFGRDVYLCWRLGEDAVTHWHDIDAGFAGRQPL